MNSNMNYLTPIKDISNLKVARTAAQSRQGDWVCLVCNNLNFSFRKRCNRCKTQTRSQNDHCSASSDNYSLYFEKPSEWCTSAYSHIETPQRQGTPERRPKKQLPSVSPLVRKYTANSSGRASLSNGEGDGSVWGVEVNAFDQSIEELGFGTSQVEEQQEQDQMQLLLRNIVL